MGKPCARCGGETREKKEHRSSTACYSKPYGSTVLRIVFVCLGCGKPQKDCICT